MSKLDQAAKEWIREYPQCFNMEETRGKDSYKGFVAGALWAVGQIDQVLIHLQKNNINYPNLMLLHLNSAIAEIKQKEADND